MTTTLIAKPIVKNQLWVITDGNGKVGNVEADGAGFNVKIGGTVEHFASTRSIEDIKHIEFQRPVKAKPVPLTYAVWPTDVKKTHNNVYDVQRKMHVYTKTAKSKCYHAAGWYNLNLNGEWTTEFCPKYIFIQRYEYTGPHMTKDEAENS
jgi:hypothetical protein